MDAKGCVGRDIVKKEERGRKRSHSTINHTVIFQSGFSQESLEGKSPNRRSALSLVLFT